MRRKLRAEKVSFIVVHDTNTTVNQALTLDSIKTYRSGQGYQDIGFHYVVFRDGKVTPCIPISDAGTHTPRFDALSIGVLLVGGRTTRGKPSCNYTRPQLAALKRLLIRVHSNFPNAALVGAGELVGGSSPHFDVKEFYEDATRQGTEAP